MCSGTLRWACLCGNTRLLAREIGDKPATFVAISVVLIVVGVLACWMPARWAMKMDPTMALRYE